jgi:HSP20 family molecular chaperone IbpA
MSAMATIGPRRPVPPHAYVSEDPAGYVIQFDVSDFAPNELAVDVIGSHVVVTAEQPEHDEDAGKPFALHERIEESLRLPEDADPDYVRAIYNAGTLELHARRRRQTRHHVSIERTYLVDPTPKGC